MASLLSRKLDDVAGSFPSHSGALASAFGLMPAVLEIVAAVGLHAGVQQALSGVLELLAENRPDASHFGLIKPCDASEPGQVIREYPELPLREQQHHVGAALEQSPAGGAAKEIAVEPGNVRRRAVTAVPR